MDGRQKPDPKPENENELNDEQVIDLTQIVEGGDNGDIIDLTEILEEPDQALEAMDEPDEVIIPLVDAIPTDTSTDLPEDTDDEIIELTAVAATPETPADKPGAASTQMPDEDEEVIDLVDVATTLETDLTEAEPDVPDTMAEESIPATEDEDEVIDLMDVATPREAETADAGLQNDVTMAEETAGTTEEDEPIIDLLDALAPPPEEAETTIDADDEFIDLESRAQAILTDAKDPFGDETPEEAAETAGPDSDFMVFEDGEPIMDDGEMPAIVDKVKDSLPEIPDPVAGGLFVPVSSSETVPLTEAQVEAALERTIEKIYGEKIEQLMIRAIEKTVTKEIARIKNALLEDDDDMV